MCCDGVPDEFKKATYRGGTNTGSAGTQDQLALLVETSTDTIGRIERKQKIASYEVLFRIARYFDKPVEDVFWYE